MIKRVGISDRKYRAIVVSTISVREASDVAGTPDMQWVVYTNGGSAAKLKSRISY
jgi:hypothetical protein